MNTVERKSITINGATYTIASEGEVYGAYGQPIKLRPDTCGYATFTAGRKGHRTRVSVHRLVAELFIPNPNNLPEVDHKDANRMNPSKENLEWVTHEENVKRAYARGNHVGRAVGENNPRVKMNAALVLRLRAEYGAGATIQELAEKYNHPWSTIGNAVKGYTWKHLSA